MEDQKEKIPNPRTSKEIDASQGTFAQEALVMKLGVHR